MAVITISRQLGSLGTEIAQALAQRLSYDYVDKEKIAEALAGYGLPAPEMDRFDEKKPPFWDSLQIQRRKFLHFLQAVIYDFAKGGNIVIVGRGGQVLLKDLPGVLHCKIVAPFELRVKRIVEKEGGDERQAGRRLRRSDRDSAGFIRSFFDVDWNDPGLYDLILNTQNLSVETAVRMILESVSSPEIREAEKRASEKLSDLALLQRVEAGLLSILGIDIRHVNIQIEKGAVILRGAVASGVEKENCERAVTAIEGVNAVDNQLLVTENYRFGA